MDPEVERTIALLKNLQESLPPEGPVTLSEEYLVAVARVQALPQNRPGADKSWVETADRRFREHYARAKPV